MYKVVYMLQTLFKKKTHSHILAGMTVNVPYDAEHLFSTLYWKFKYHVGTRDSAQPREFGFKNSKLKQVNDKKQFIVFSQQN